jgi:RNA polymerase sigma-70 factor, ECF subfamily
MTKSVPHEVIVRAKHGSLEETGELYARYHQSIYRYLYYRIGDPHIAEDLTGDVFLRMVKALPSFQVGTVPFQAWLFQVARNVAIDHFRRTNAHPITAIDDNLHLEGQALESLVDFRIASADLALAISRLDESQRDVLLLRFIEGLPIAETAKVLHKSEDSVKALQRRALLALRSMFQIEEKDDEQPG